MSSPLLVVIGEDDVLLREGIARLRTEAALDVVVQATALPTFCARTSPTIPRF